MFLRFLKQSQEVIFSKNVLKETPLKCNLKWGLFSSILLKKQSLS